MKTKRVDVVPVTNESPAGLVSVGNNVTVTMLVEGDDRAAVLRVEGILHRAVDALKIQRIEPEKWDRDHR